MSVSKLPAAGPSSAVHLAILLVALVAYPVKLAAKFIASKF